MEIEVYFSYRDFNAAYAHTGVVLHEDTHVEQVAFVVVIRKWRWNDNHGDPDLPFPGVELAQEVTVSDKTDAFIFEYC